MTTSAEDDFETSDRRDFLTTTTAVAMAGGLAAGYGTFAVMAGRFLYATDGDSVAWQFFVTIDRFGVGDSLAYVAPLGASVVVARQSEGAGSEDFIALSSVCPHLGCQVHWEPQHDRFFCPCHNGAFDRDGKATQGPPAAAGQELSRFPLKVENGLLYIEVPMKSVAGRNTQVALSHPQPADGRGRPGEASA
jgi:Rieske Fe-S protein